MKRAARVGILAFMILAPGFWWGVPHATAPDRVDAWGVDDETPLGPLAEIHNIIDPQPDAWLSYPLLASFVTAAAYSPYLGYLVLSSGLSEPSPTYPFGLSNPVRSLAVLAWIAHLVSVLLGTVTVVAVFLTARLLWDDATAVLGAGYMVVSFPFIYYSRTGNVDAIALTCFALTLLAFARIVTAGLTPRRLWQLGLAAGLALAAKESIVGALAIIPFAVLALAHPWRRGASGMSWREFARHASVALVVSVVAFGVGSGLMVAPSRYLAHVAYLRELLALVSSGHTPVADAFTFTTAGTLGYIAAMGHRLVTTLTWFGILGALIGLVATARTAPRVLWTAAPAAGYMAYLASSYRLAQTRYLLPVLLVSLLFAAAGTSALWRARHRWLRAGGILLALGLLGLETARTVGLTYEMVRDSRWAAGTWLEKRTGAGDIVSYFGSAQKLPPLKAGVVSSIATPDIGMYAFPRTDAAHIETILHHWAEERPAFIIISPDHTSPAGVPYPHTCPPELYEGLVAGRYGYHLVAKFQTPALLPGLPLPALDYPVINPPIRVFVRDERAADALPRR